MKKKMNRKLVLNKNTVTSLNDNEMNKVIGATLVWHCTKSCSLVWYCCSPPEENVYDPNQDNDLG